jgi:subtilisin family serine protease
MPRRSGRRAVPVVVAAVLAAAVLLPSASIVLGKEPRTKAIGPIPQSAKDRPHGKLPKPAALRAPDRLIVKFRSSAEADTRKAIRAKDHVNKVRDLGLIRAEVVRPSAGQSVNGAVSALKRDPNVEYAVPDYYRQSFGDPTAEPLYAQQWGLNNTGQSVKGFFGVPNIDIDAPEGFGVTQGDPSVVVAVIDDGVDFSHPDLAGQAWVNPLDGTVDGLDDDGNGLTDDVNGWDFCNNDASVHDVDEDFHGTGVAGVIAGSATGIGITGVAPGVRIMALKFLDPTNEACSTDDLAISAIDYAKTHGAQIINASWGGPGGSVALQDAIEASQLVFVAAAGNGGDDVIGDNIDSDPIYPAAFTSANIITVAAIHNQGGLSSFSNYGTTSVDVAAPGEDIEVAVAATSIDPYGWALESGTSYSAPHVAGIAALIGSVRPALLATPLALRQRLLDESWTLNPTVGLTAHGTVADSMLAVDFVPPAAAAPSAALISPATLGTSTAGVRISWPRPIDATSGVCGYVLQRFVIGGTWASIAASTTRTSVTQSLSIGTSYQFRLRARDCAGNTTYPVANSFRALRTQENATWITYRGTWTRQAVSGASGSYTKYATRSSASASLRFTGRSVGLVMPMSRSRGSFRVYIDNVLVKTISLYSTTTKARQVVFAQSWAAYGGHTIKVVPVGTAGHPRVDIDAFIVLR